MAQKFWLTMKRHRTLNVSLCRNLVLGNPLCRMLDHKALSSKSKRHASGRVLAARARKLSPRVGI